MINELTSLETSILAREKGFKWDVSDFWLHSKGDSTPVKVADISLISDYNSFPPKKRTSRPTQSLLQRWLRDVHKMDVYPIREYKTAIFYTIEIVGEIDGIQNVLNPGELYRTYEEALEEGLKVVLNMIDKLK